jgi:3-deoxy-D-manno-octulosonate 8-phosphate phosphatase (KDO 8-P phosphatase)
MVTRVLTGDVLRARAARIRLVLTDCDGVLTDAGVYYSARGEELKRFSMRDGMGIERLRTVAGIPVGILTKERSGIVAARARALHVHELHGGVVDKLRRAEGIARSHGLTLDRIAFIGDDVNDLALLRAAGLSACPADAEPVITGAVHHVCGRAGGHGAFREFAELILDAQAVPGIVPHAEPTEVPCEDPIAASRSSPRSASITMARSISPSS